jgi:ABC-type uncharacterized transport system auxiliary subunit
MMRSWASVTACAAALLMASCGGKILYPKYYTLEIPPAPARAVNGTRFSGIVAVRRFDSAQYLRQGRIVYREAPEEIGFYEYHRWADDPAQMVTTAMIESLRSARLFSLVKPYDGHDQQDYLIVGRLERLEELDYGNAVGVVAKISAELVNLRTGSTEWSDDAAETLKVDKANVNSVVLEMSHAVQKSIDHLVASLDQQTLAKK